MEEADVRVELTEQEKIDLRHYAVALKQSVDPVLSQYSPIAIGGRKRPKERRLEAEYVHQRRESLQEKFGIDYGKHSGRRWKLEVANRVDVRWTERGDRIDYYWIFPLNSGRKEVLDYLAEKSLPEFFIGEKFVVGDTYVPCGNNDCNDSI